MKKLRNLGESIKQNLKLQDYPSDHKISDDKKIQTNQSSKKRMTFYLDALDEDRLNDLILKYLNKKIKCDRSKVMSLALEHFFNHEMGTNK
jgi:hypothetical protein